MALQKTFMRCLVALVALALGACATDVQHYADVPTAHIVEAAESIKSVTVTLSPDGQRDFADNSAFDQNALLANVQRVLQAKQLYSATTGGDTLETQITAIRVRSTFNAVMWGFMAGSDNLRGDVYVRDPSGKLVNHFSVYASYALGGFVGGVRSVRWGWLYNKFAELVAQNLTS
jgi:hypothetical protein